MKKHILFLSGGLKIGGVERVLIEYLNNIDREKYKITLFLMSDFGKEAVLRDELNEEIEVKYIKPLELLEEKKKLQQNKKNIFRKLKYSKFLKNEKKYSYKNFSKNLAEISKVDIIIDFDRSFMKYTKYMRNIPKFIWIHSSVIELDKCKEINIKKFDRYLRNYNKIVAICSEMSEEIRDLYPLLSKKLAVLYNPFDFDRIIKKSFDRNELNNDEKKMMNDNYLIAVSRIEKISKDIPTLINAYNILQKNGLTEKLYIIGDGDEKLEIERMIKEMKLEESVYLLGAKKNPFIWIKNSKLFVHSSKFEGLSTVLIEAMILEKLIVSSLCKTGVKEILDNGNCGLFFEVGNETEFAEQMIKILSDEELQNKFKENMKEKVKEFKKENIITKFCELLESIWE